MQSIGQELVTAENPESKPDQEGQTKNQVIEESKAGHIPSGPDEIRKPIANLE